ncbi:hypothetical protein NBE98_08540 [Clostridium swellfunianum]|uniref:hypothetical protein n=1 Tax=Clostridium swellfunianum TaxID=1367462 RepID=UPI00202F0951|nr:hypothetical protein [Clostridium swellfunianum]MCM0648420.1 hypothetical protein [Clostridium swellfunianum]
MDNKKKFKIGIYWTESHAGEIEIEAESEEQAEEYAEENLHELMYDIREKQDQYTLVGDIDIELASVEEINLQL